MVWPLILIGCSASWIPKSWFWTVSRIRLTGLAEAPRETVEMGFRSSVIDFLCNPNIALMLGYIAMLAFTIEFLMPGGFIAGTIGVICIVLSLVAGQSLPINSGGLVLLFIAFILFIVELLVPSFGFWGIAGIVCLVIGSIYFIDTDLVWGAAGFTVDLVFVSVFSVLMLIIFSAIAFLVFRTKKLDLRKEKDALIGAKANVLRFFSGVEGSKHVYGKVDFEGRELPASLQGKHAPLPDSGTVVTIVAIENDGSRVIVEV